MRLAGRRVLVTGAASGIGLAVARVFQREGARVARLDRDERRLKDAAVPDAVPVVADVADERQVRGAVERATAALGGLDAVVNSAGIDLLIDTPLFRSSWQGASDPQAELAKILDRYVIKRAGDSEDIANAALYLTSDESAFVTGIALAVDGGRTFH